MKYYFPGKFDNPRYSENYNMDWPETKKFGISVIENHILDLKIKEIMKYYFPGKFGNPRYLENKNPDWPETKIIGTDRRTYTVFKI